MARYTRKTTHKYARQFSPLERFNKKFRVNPKTKCWDWTASSAGEGYGYFWLGDGIETLAHRASYVLHIGKIPAGADVLHSCDNRKCVNPAHFFLGDDRANMLDMISKRRQNWSVGERGANAKLTERKVRQLLKDSESMGCVRLARKYLISESQAGRIVSGKQWRHLTRLPRC